jgi:hypothetical protein
MVPLGELSLTRMLNRLGLAQKVSFLVLEVAVLGKTFAPFQMRSILLIINASPQMFQHREGDQNALA